MCGLNYDDSPVVLETWYQGGKIFANLPPTSSMKLREDKIRDRLATGDVEISPFDEDEQINTASVTLRLDDTLMMYRTGGPLDPSEETKTEFKRVGDTLWLNPGEFALASTREEVSLPDDLGGEIKASEDVGRMGLNIQNTGWLDPDTEGKLTLELVNNSPRPVRLHAGMPIVKLVFDELSTEAETAPAVEIAATEEVERLDPETTKILVDDGQQQSSE